MTNTNTNTNTTPTTTLPGEGMREYYARTLTEKTKEELLAEYEKTVIGIEREGYGGSKIARDMETLLTSEILSRMN